MLIILGDCLFLALTQERPFRDYRWRESLRSLEARSKLHELGKILAEAIRDAVSSIPKDSLSQGPEAELLQKDSVRPLVVVTLKECWNQCWNLPVWNHINFTLASPWRGSCTSPNWSSMDISLSRPSPGFRSRCARFSWPLDWVRTMHPYGSEASLRPRLRKKVFSLLIARRVRSCYLLFFEGLFYDSMLYVLVFLANPTQIKTHLRLQKKIEVEDFLNHPEACCCLWDKISGGSTDTFRSGQSPSGLGGWLFFGFGYVLK